VTQVVDPIDRSLIDPAVGPSDDYYRHVNGGWLDANPVPPEYPRWGAFDILNATNQERLHVILQRAAGDTDAAADSPERMVGDYFAAGMDEAAIERADIDPIRGLLASIDGTQTSADILAVTSELQRLAGDPFHSLSVAPDFEDAEAYLVYVGEGGLGLPEREYYLGEDERSVGLREAYRAHVAAQLGNLGEDEATAGAHADAILAFERRLAEVTFTPEVQRDPQQTLHRYAIDDLDGLMPAHGLTAYTRGLGVTSATVNIDNPDFFRALDDALGDTPIETLRAYLRWNLVRGTASALPKRFEDEAFAFYGRTLNGQQEPKPRWKRILEAGTRDIGEQVARLYVAEAFPPSAKARCEHLVEHLLDAMGTAIRNASWMGEATRAEALAKLDAFGFKIGYPDTWRDYSALAIGRESHALNRMAASEFEYRRELGRLGEPVDKGEWALPAHVVNAYYHPLLNEIVFPAGILQPPFFYADADDAVNYGAIGVVIGHEITHGFDDTGSRFDAEGALRDWWTAEDRAEFERRAQVLIDQYDGFHVLEDVTVNGKLTIGENIADLGGVTIAWEAMHEALAEDPPAVGGSSPQERFFQSFATMWRTNTTDAYARMLNRVDVHSPSRFRVNGPLQNFPPFAELYGVAEDAPMGRAAGDRVRIW
jgi:predicted metalloendopeptidase